jgi:hypothetical protein
MRNTKTNRPPLKKKENPVNVVNIMKTPIWLRANFVGKINGTKFRFTYNEFTNDDCEEVIKTFKFVWPGKIPDDLQAAEKGIIALFKAQQATSVEMKVAPRVIETINPQESDEVVEEEMRKLDNEEIVIDETLED